MGEQGRPAIDAHGDAAMRRSAVVEGLQDAAEALVHLLERVALQREAPLQQLALVDSDRASAQLPAVQRDVVLHGPSPTGRILPRRLVGIARGGHEKLLVLRHDAAERVVGGVPAAPLGVPLVHREVVDPAVGQHVLIGQAQTQAQLLAQAAQDVRHDLVVGVGDDQDQVARLRRPRP